MNKNLRVGYTLAGALIFGAVGLFVSVLFFFLGWVGAITVPAIIGSIVGIKTLKIKEKKELEEAFEELNWDEIKIQ